MNVFSVFSGNSHLGDITAPNASKAMKNAKELYKSIPGIRIEPGAASDRLGCGKSMSGNEIRQTVQKMIGGK